MRYSDALPFASKHRESTFELFADALEDTDEADAAAEADFEEDELLAEDDVALEAEDAFDAEEDAFDSELGDDWLMLVATAAFELVDWLKPDATSGVEELALLVRP